MQNTEPVRNHLDNFYKVKIEKYLDLLTKMKITINSIRLDSSDACLRVENLMAKPIIDNPTAPIASNDNSFNAVNRFWIVAPRREDNALIYTN